MKDTVLIEDRKIELAAKIAHNVNVAYCTAIGDQITLGDWEHCPEWQKESCIAGVKFHMVNPESTPKDSHNSWLAHKLKDGWVYGPIKDSEMKTHPYMLPYEDLPLEQKVKDYLFKSVVDSIMK